MNEVLAKSLLYLANDPQYTDAQKVTRIQMHLGQHRMAALADILDPQKEMAKAGAFVALVYGSHGYTVSVNDPLIKTSGWTDTINVLHQDPAQAMATAYDRWKTARGLSDEPQQLGKVANRG